MTDAVETARSFVTAVAWGEHRTVWDLLGPEGRRTVMRVAVAAGMDEALAGRLREGTAGNEEREEFLADLVNGLRADLTGAEVDTLSYELDTESAQPGRARVVMMAPMPEILGGDLPVGSVELIETDGRWVVERLVPLTRPTP